jgi:hypothetical protein
VDSEEEEAVDRNWNELLQELRVTQTGLQILTGFLATLPFQQRFASLSPGQHHFYLVVLSVAVVATIVVLAPASFHRLLFRQQEKEFLVQAGNICARGALALSGLAVSGVGALLFSVVAGVPAGVVAGVVILLGFMGVWIGIPLFFRRRSTLAPTPRQSPRS